MKASEFIRKNYLLYQDKSVMTKECAEQTGVPIKQCRSVYHKIIHGLSGDHIREHFEGTDSTLPANVGCDEVQETETRIYTLTQLREMHNLLIRIKTALDSLKRGEFYEEREFINKHQLNMPGYRGDLDRKEFDIYRGKGGQTVYYSHPESISTAKNEHTLK